LVTKVLEIPQFTKGVRVALGNGGNYFANLTDYNVSIFPQFKTKYWEIYLTPNPEFLAKNKGEPLNGNLQGDQKTLSFIMPSGRL